MSLPTSILAYEDCRQLFDAALDDEAGARMRVDDYDRGLYMRTRLNYFRALHRADNSRTYGEDHPMFGKSEYDRVTVRIKRIEEDFYVYLERNDVTSAPIEKLTNATDPT